MKTMRTILAIVVGYLVYAVGSMLLVGPVTTREGPAIVAFGILGLVLIGALAGFLAGALAPASARVAGAVLAGLVALATIANLVLALGAEPVWYKAGTLLLTAPLIVLAAKQRAK